MRYISLANPRTLGPEDKHQLLLVLVIPSEPHSQPVDGRLVLGMQVDELGQLPAQPGKRHFLFPAPVGQFLDAAIGEVHG